MSFIQNAQRATTLDSFVKESLNQNGVKYVAERKTKHFIYVPYTEVPNVSEAGSSTQKAMVGYTAKVHEWYGPDGKYRSTVCLEGIIQEDAQGNIINDGTCPICNRVENAWDIYKHRIALASANSPTGKPSDADKRAILDERKAKAATPYIYMLVAQFKTAQNGAPIINDVTNLPDFELKVMKLSTSRSQKMEKAISTTSGDLLGAEILFDYPDVDDKRQLIMQCVTAGIYPQSPKSIVGQYPAVIDEINKAVAAFSWEGIEKSFPEWKGMTVKEANAYMATQFKKFDDWKKALEVDPNAQYLEYTGTTTATSTPALNVPSADSVFGEHSGVALADV